MLIDEADSMIDSKAGLRYTVPFTTVPDDIRFLSINIACYKAFARKLGANKVSEDWKATYEQCLTDLNEIADGSLYINATATSEQATMVNETDDRIVAFHDTDNLLSEY